MARMFKIAIVDDHPVLRRGIKETFTESPDFDVVGEGASAEEAATIAREKRPDLMLLDVTMPGGGVEAAAEVRTILPQAQIMMLSIREDLSTVRSALKAGAKGYVSKGVDGTELVAAARRVMSGERYVSPELAARLLLSDSPASDSKDPASRGNASSLTLREQQICELLGQGLSNLEIADKLMLSENTIKHYITALLSKLGVRNRTEAALLTRQNDFTRTTGNAS